MQLDDKFFVSAYREVEETLRKAVEASKSPEDFQKNLAKMQVIAQRTLAILAFNSALSSKSNPMDLMPKITEGVRREIEDIMKAAKEGEDKLTAVELKERQDKNAAH